MVRWVLPAPPSSTCHHHPPRFAYKDEYEKFKLYLTIILILISFTCRFLFNSRWVGDWLRGPGGGSCPCSGRPPRPPAHPG